MSSATRLVFSATPSITGRHEGRRSGVVSGISPMIDIKFSRQLGVRARIWVDELPPFESLAKEVAWRREGFSGTKLSAFHKRIVVEVFQPFGAAFHYGLLGADLRSGTSDGLVVTVPVNMPNPNALYTGALAEKVDEVVVGSTPEFAEAVLVAARNFPSELLPSGELNFVFMAHSTVGSARIVFEKLTKAIFRLMGTVDIPWEESGVLEVLERA